MIKTFVERPVLSTVISIIIVALGIISIFVLPIEQYPDIAPPTVKIVAQYPGANTDVIMNSVIIPIEEQVNGVEGMTYMTSTASSSGLGSIDVYFEKGVDPDIAAVNVQNLVARATPMLPAEVNQMGVIVRKQLSSYIMMLAIYSTNPDYDAQFVQNYLNINLLPEIQRVNGVGDASVMGAKDYSMRVWLKPDIMATYGITPTEVIAALSDQNIEAAPGQLGERASQTYQYTLRYTGRLKSAEEFENIIIRSQKGHLLKLKDVADVELGSEDYSVESRTNGHESVFISISQTAGSNAQDVIRNVKEVVDRAREDFPPGIEFVYMSDATLFLNASIKNVIQTFIEALFLVFLVVFIFLQDFKSTVIPAIAIPVSIIGAFFFIQILGFSINILTLLSLVLAIGIVVDDAIIVVEAVHAQLEKGYQDVKQATLAAMKEITPAIVSITLVMASVFIPVSFIGGTRGIFFQQFGLTLAFAIGISAVNALTLTPALCALFLKPYQDEEKKKTFLQRFFYSFNVGFEYVTGKYRSSLRFLSKPKSRWLAFAIVGVFGFILYSAMDKIPSGFVPAEDSGGLMGVVTMTPGTSLEITQQMVDEVIAIAEEIEGVDFITNITGVNFMGGLGGISSSYGSLIIKLVPWDQRELSSADVASILTEKTSHINNAQFLFFGMPTLQGFGMSTGVEMQMQDRTGGDIHEFFDVTNQFLDAMSEKDEVMVAMTTFNPNFPQKEIEANIPKIKEAGLSLGDVMGAMQAYIGSMYVSDFNIYGKQFRVMVQSSPEYREKLDDLHGLFVRTPTGEMAPITEFVTINDVTGPQMLTRFNMFQSMTVTLIPDFAKGYSTGDVLQVIDDVAADVLPHGYSYDFSGMTREETGQGKQTLIIFLIIIMFVYLLLSALYESYIVPFAVLFSLPVGLAGVFIFLAIFGLHKGIVNNIYVQVSMIMLIGLLAKNAILIVEYALQRREQGQTIANAAVNGAIARLRPILMTSFALVFGLLPLMFSSGAGSFGNQSVGISAVGGMFVGTIVGIFVIPTLFIVFQMLHERISGRPKVVVEAAEKLAEQRGGIN